MPRPVLVVIMLTLVFGMIFGIHYYFWARLVRDTALPAVWRSLATAALLCLAVSMPVFFVLVRVAWSPARLLAWPAFLWMGMMFFLLLLVFGSDLVRGAVVAFHALRGEPLDPERRLALQRLLGAAVASAAALVGGLAVRGALRPVALRELAIDLPRLPESLAGTTIVQMSDLHIGPTLGREFIAELVRRSNALAPDVVVITGDLADGPVRDLREAAAPLGDLKARHGVYFVTGNHEYYSGADAWIAELGRLGVRVLRNERVPIGDGVDSFDLAGIDDYNARGQAPGHGPDLPRALAGRDPLRALVLLAHQPRAIHEAERLGVGLQLSGHTHGGQMWPWNYMVRLQQPYIAGLVRHGEAQLYVSPGTGYWGPPMRLGTVAEITRITLSRAA